MTIERSEALASLQHQQIRSQRVAVQREALWERIGEGTIKPIDLDSRERIDSAKAKTTASARRAELSAENAGKGIQELFLEVGQREVPIPFPLKETELLALHAIIGFPDTRIGELQDLLNLRYDKSGRKRLGWQHVRYSLKHSCTKLFRRTHSADGIFSTPQEQKLWEEIKAYTLSQTEEPFHNDYQIYRAFRNKLLWKWFGDRLPNKNGAKQTNALPETTVQAENEAPEITIEAGKTYIIKAVPGKSASKK